MDESRLAEALGTLLGFVLFVVGVFLFVAILNMRPK